MVELARKKVKEKETGKYSNEFSLPSYNCHAVVCVVDDKCSTDTDFCFCPFNSQSNTAVNWASRPIPE